MLLGYSKLLILVAVNTLALPPRNVELDSVVVTRDPDEPHSFYTCPLAFKSNECAVDGSYILNDSQCRNLCTCNNSNRAGCNAYGTCAGSRVLDICDNAGGCGCYTRIIPPAATSTTAAIQSAV